MEGISANKIISSVKSFPGGVFPGFGRWIRLPGLVSWAAVAAGTLLAFRLPFGTGTPLLHGAALLLPAVLAVAGIVLRPPLLRFGAFLAFAFLLCLARRAHQADVLSFSRDPAVVTDTVIVSGRVLTAPLPYQESFRFLLKIISADDARFRTLVGATVNCVMPDRPPLYGTVTAAGVFSPPEPRRNPFEYDGFMNMMSKGVWGTFSVVKSRTLSVKRSFPERLAAAFRGVATAALRKVADYDNRALLYASFLGDTAYLSPYVKDLFRASGIYHLIAISGLNTAMLVGALYFFLSLFRLRRTAAHLVCIAALWAYLPFVGMIPSLFRATVMATCVIAAVFFEKKNYALHTLGLAGTVWFAVSPESLFEPGYQLSFAATAGILALHPVFSRFAPDPANRFLRPVASFFYQSLFISTASFCATAPVLLYHFGTISFFGLLANLVAVAAMTAAMWAFFAGLLLQLAVPPLAAIPLWFSERFLDIVVGTGKAATLIPWLQATYPAPPPAMLLLAVLFLIGLAALRPGLLKPYLLASLAAAAIAVSAGLLARRLPQRLEAVSFTVPRCHLLGVRWPDSRVWVIAPDPGRSLPYLMERHVVPWMRHHAGRTRLDALLVPAGFGGTAAALFREKARTRPRAVFVFPYVNNGAADSPVPVFIPCGRCTCAVTGGPGCVRARIAAPLFDTVFSFAVKDGPGKRRHDTAGTRSATVMTAGRKKIGTRAVIPPGLPVW